MFNFDFFTFWAPFWRFWEPLGPLLGGFGRPKWRPRAFQSLREGRFFFNLCRFRSFFRFSFDLEGFWDGFGRVWGGFLEFVGRILGRFEGLFQCNFEMGANNKVNHIFEKSYTIMARRNARSDLPPHRRWCEACQTPNRPLPSSRLNMPSLASKLRFPGPELL